MWGGTTKQAEIPTFPIIFWGFTPARGAPQAMRQHRERACCEEGRVQVPFIHEGEAEQGGLREAKTILDGPSAAALLSLPAFGVLACRPPGQLVSCVQPQ